MADHTYTVDPDAMKRHAEEVVRLTQLRQAQGQLLTPDHILGPIDDLNVYAAKCLAKRLQEVRDEAIEADSLPSPVDVQGQAPSSTDEVGATERALRNLQHVQELGEAMEEGSPHSPVHMQGQPSSTDKVLFNLDPLHIAKVSSKLLKLKSTPTDVMSSPRLTKSASAPASSDHLTHP